MTQGYCNSSYLSVTSELGYQQLAEPVSSLQYFEFGYMMYALGGMWLHSLILRVGL